MGFGIKIRARYAAWQTVGSLGLGAALFLGGMTPNVAPAADFSVTSTADDGTPGTMRWAIDQLNSAGAGSHSITLTNNLGTVSLLSSLPPILGTDQTISINGNNNVIDGQDQGSIFFIAGGTASISNLDLENGSAQGGNGGNGTGGGGGGLGAGGALFVNTGANVTLDNVNMDSNAAEGGNGGNGNIANGGGGGGGFGGNGGSGSNGGGGGGGLFGNGSNGSNGGGAGGGITGNGGAAANGGAGGGGILNGGNAGNAGGNGSSGASGGAMGTTSFTSAPAGDGGDGQSPLLGGGGGGGLGGSNFDTGDGGDGGNGGNGGLGGGGGGGGANGTGLIFTNTSGGPGGNGGMFGGGGGGGVGRSGNPAGGNGGDFGGGGGASLGDFNQGDGGDGGFGGGGGGSTGFSVPGGTGGFGAGNGGADNVGGGGGSGYGGAVFVRQGGTLTIINSAITSNSVAAGAGGIGGNAGTTAGAGMYLQTGVTANVEVTDANTVTYNDQITGAGGLQKTGAGTLILGASNDYTGATTANAGDLIINGTVTSIVTSAASGRVGGTGTIETLVNNNWVAPGNSIGTLNVTSNYDQSSSGTLAIEIDDSLHTDFLNVQGAANIAGAVSVFASPGNYTAGAQYTFLMANGLNGTFDSITDDLAFFDAELGYAYGFGAFGEDFVYFTLVAANADFEAIGQTVNQKAVGKYLDDNSQGATGAFQALIDDLQMMTNSQVRSALEQMSGDIYGTTQQMGVQNTTLILHTIAQQLQPQSFRNGANYDGWAQEDTVSELSDAEIVQVSYQPDGSMTFNRAPSRSRTTWAVGYGLGGHADSDGNAGSLDYGMGGAMVGFDAYWNANHRIGLYGGYVGTGIQTTNASGTNDITGGQIGAYLTGLNDIHYYTVISGFQFDGYESERFINAGGLNLTAQGDYDGWQGFAYLERGFILHETERFSTQPFGALQYVHVRQNGFTETGAGAANLSVDGLDDDSLRSLVGVRTQVRTVPSRAKITPEFRAVWVHEFLDVNSPVVATFAPVGGSSFIAEGLNMGRDWALVGTGLNCYLGRGWSAQANYDAQVNDRAAFHVGSGSVQKSW